MIVRRVAQEVAAQEAGPRSLTELHPLVLPPEVSSAPTAPGWTVLAVAIACLTVVLLVWCIARHRGLAYRREALLELAQLRASGGVRGISALLKRTALARYPRSEIASGSGADWWSFLDRTGEGSFATNGGIGRLLSEATYGDKRVSDDETRVLFDAAEAWIRSQPPSEALR